MHEKVTEEKQISEVLFETKRVMDEMDRIGGKYGTMDQCAARAADNLYLPRSHPAVAWAIAYNLYECRCMIGAEKPESLVVWFKRSAKQCFYITSKSPSMLDLVQPMGTAKTTAEMSATPFPVPTAQQRPVVNPLAQIPQPQRWRPRKAFSRFLLGFILGSVLVLVLRLL